MVYTEIVPDCAKQTLQGIIRGKVDLESVIHSDAWRSYNGLVELGYQKHFVSTMKTMISPMGKDTSTASNLSGHVLKGGS